jgi:hypothetical protein
MARTFDSVIDDLKECAESEHDYIEIYSESCRLLLDYIAALEAQLPRWISVVERLPDLNEVVLTIYQTREGFGAITLRSRFDDDYWYCGEVGGLVPNRNITHWMPLSALPQPPEGE